MAADLYVHLAPRLSVAHCDAVSHPQTMPGRYDVLYSVYGAIDFTDPRELLPATADVRARTPGGKETVMRRWALQEHVWTKLLHEADFAEGTIDPTRCWRVPTAPEKSGGYAGSGSVLGPV